MSMLLLVRSAEDMRSAVEATNEFLIYERRRVAEPIQTDEVLGIWIRRELDANLPAWLLLDGEPGSDVLADVPGGGSKIMPGEAGVGLRESFSRSGLWALCWFDGTLLRTAHNASERRRTILDSLLGITSASKPPSATETFFPVFAAADAFESVKATLRDLQGRYPQIIGKTWFVDHLARGIVPTQETDR